MPLSSGAISNAAHHIASILLVGVDFPLSTFVTVVGVIPTASANCRFVPNFSTIRALSFKRFIIPPPSLCVSPGLRPAAAALWAPLISGGAKKEFTTVISPFRVGLYRLHLLPIPRARICTLHGLLLILAGI